jgi:tyrosyl-tRNA synthetase
MTLPLSHLASMTAVDLAVASGAASSRNEARTLLRGGGVYINGAR